MRYAMVLRVQCRWLIILALILVASVIPANARSTPEITSISALPAAPRSDEALRINATVVNRDNVTGVTITYCTASVCSIPITMKNESGTYTYRFIENKFKPGYVNFTITVDFTVDATYTSISRDLNLTIAEGEPAPGGKDDDDEAPGFEVMSFAGAVLTAAFIGRKVRS